MPAAALQKRQSQVRSGIVYLGLKALGKGFDRSRSTAYRAERDLVAAGLIERLSGGGKTHDENGRLVEAANGYKVPERYLGRPRRRGGRRPRKPRPQPVDERTPGQQLAQEILERHRAIRAGP